MDPLFFSSKQNPHFNFDYSCWFISTLWFAEDLIGSLVDCSDYMQENQQPQFNQSFITMQMVNG